MEDLTREELKDLMESYNDYVMHFSEEHEVGMEPVSIYEYYDNEYQLKQEEDDECNYCANCGCKKEDYESMYCDECFEEEQERLYENTDEEEINYEKIGVSVNDTMDGLEICVIGDKDILETYRIKMNIARYSKMDLYNITKEVARKLTMYYYQTSANLPTLEQVEDMIKDELLK